MMDDVTEQLISVVMPVYNSEKYLHVAIASILNQSYPHFEFIIVDDGSQDKSQSIISSITDKRIKYIRNVENKGIVYSLNKAIEISKGNFIARMDSDDVSLPRRFELQIKAFKDNPQLVVCGTWYKSIYKDRFLNNNKLAVSNGQMKAQLLFGNPICHPSVMFKKTVWENNSGFLKEEINCEDFGLWSRAKDAGDFYNIPQYLLNYRIHDSNVSKTNTVLRIQAENNIIAASFARQLNVQSAYPSLINSDVRINDTTEFINAAFQQIQNKDNDYKNWAKGGLFRLLISKIGLRHAIRKYKGSDGVFLTQELLYFINEKFRNRLIHGRKFIIDRF
jgi:glycosyltransferase involved in cell wall biosynthesis